MNLPKSIRVGYRDYTVIDWQREDAEGAARFGECDKNRAIIKVCLDYGPAKSANTLLHEVLHAAYMAGRLNDKEPEEKVVSVLSDQLSQIWRDNPEFVAFMSTALTDGTKPDTQAQS